MKLPLLVGVCLTVSSAACAQGVPAKFGSWWMVPPPHTIIIAPEWQHKAARQAHHHHRKAHTKIARHHHQCKCPVVVAPVPRPRPAEQLPQVTVTAPPTTTSEPPKPPTAAPEAPSQPAKSGPPAAPTNPSVYGAGQYNCQLWITSGITNDKQTTLKFTSWVAGFFSGYDELARQSEDGIDAEMIQYCQKHLDESVFHAAVTVRNALIPSYSQGP